MKKTNKLDKLIEIFEDESKNALSALTMGCYLDRDMKEEKLTDQQRTYFEFVIKFINGYIVPKIKKINEK